MRRFLLVLGLLLAACSGDDGEETSPSTTADPTSTTADDDATTTTADEAGGATTTVGGDEGDEGDGAEEPGADLDDGEHPAFLETVDVEGRIVTVDVVQFLTGDEAAAAYEEETGDTGGPPNDYYIVNENPRLRELEVAADADIQLLTNPGGPDLGPGTLDDLADRGENSGALLWLTVADGVVTEIEEQFLP